MNIRTMKRTRHVVAITLMAAALCADRAVAAAPSLRPQVAAGKLVMRLSVSLRRVVPAVQVYPARHEAISSETVVSICEVSTILPDNSGLSPWLLNLPPPAV